MSATEHSLLGKNLLLKAEEFLDAQDFSTLFLYFPFNNEPDLLPLGEKRREEGTILALPSVEKESAMSFYEWKEDTTLIKNRFGIPEPDKASSKKIVPDEKSIFFVPSLALDRSGTRLGMGAGFYDRYLKKHKSSLKVGLVFQYFLLDQIPSESHDIKMDVILTDKEIISL